MLCNPLYVELMITHEDQVGLNKLDLRNQIDVKSVGRDRFVPQTVINDIDQFDGVHCPLWGLLSIKVVTLEWSVLFKKYTDALSITC